MNRWVRLALELFGVLFAAVPLRMVVDDLRVTAVIAVVGWVVARWIMRRHPVLRRARLGENLPEEPGQR